MYWKVGGGLQSEEIFLDVICATFSRQIYYPILPHFRWEDNIKMDLQEVGGSCGDRMELARIGTGGGRLWLR